MEPRPSRPQLPHPPSAVLTPSIGGFELRLRLRLACAYPRRILGVSHRKSLLLSGTRQRRARTPRRARPRRTLASAWQTSGSEAGCALPGGDHPQPAGPIPSGLAAKLQRLFLTQDPPHGGLNGLGKRWEVALAALDTAIDITDADDTAVDNGTVRVRKPPAVKRRKSTPLQTARWTPFRRRSAGGCRFEGSPGNWASIGTRRKSTWKLRARPRSGIGSDRSRLLSPRAIRVTFSLAT